MGGLPPGRGRCAGAGCCCSRTPTGLARFLRWRGFAAITLGHVIVTNRRLNDGLLAHELEHVAQHERWGPLYYPAYLLGSVRGYRRNPFERAARQAADAVLAALEERTQGRRG